MDAASSGRIVGVGELLSLSLHVIKREGPIRNLTRLVIKLFVMNGAFGNIASPVGCSTAAGESGDEQGGFEQRW
jgi:hypothetical protein